MFRLSELSFVDKPHLVFFDRNTPSAGLGACFLPAPSSSASMFSPIRRSWTSAVSWSDCANVDTSAVAGQGAASFYVNLVHVDLRRLVRSSNATGPSTSSANRTGRSLRYHEVLHAPRSLSVLIGITIHLDKSAVLGPGPSFWSQPNDSSSASDRLLGETCFSRGAQGYCVLTFAVPSSIHVAVLSMLSTSSGKIFNGAVTEACYNTVPYKIPLAYLRHNTPIYCSKRDGRKG